MNELSSISSDVAELASHRIPDFACGTEDSDESTIQNRCALSADAMNLPVANLEAAIPFYESIMGFRGRIAE